MAAVAWLLWHRSRPVLLLMTVVARVHHDVDLLVVVRCTLMKQKSASTSWHPSEEDLAISRGDEVGIDIRGGAHGGVLSSNEGDESGLGRGEGRKKEKLMNHFFNQSHGR
jgi:hypothetical protein